jgi:outer membrane receptor protein involved in Fe transport
MVHSAGMKEGFLLRAGFAQTIGRPELSQIIPGVTITDPTSTAAVKTITIVNSGLKPWTANNYDLSFELYGARGASADLRS